MDWVGESGFGLGLASGHLPLNTVNLLQLVSGRAHLERTIVSVATVTAAIERVAIESVAIPSLAPY